MHYKHNITILPEKLIQLVSSEFVSLQLQSTEAIEKLIKQYASKFCLLDPIPTILLKDEIILSAQCLTLHIL